MKKMEIPFFTNKYQDELYGNKIREKIDEIIKKGVFILGEEVKLFEKRVSEFTGIKYCIGVANGSDALYLAINSLHLPESSEVITTPFTFFASTSCITRNKLKPVFVDVDEDTYNIDVSKIEGRINKKTSCILPVDLFAQTADMDKISDIAGKNNLKIIEDSAEAFGMKWNGLHAGMKADAAVLSFYPTKTLSCCGDGGMVLTNDEITASEIKMLRSHGASKKYHHKVVGINSRLDEIQAGILNIKLDHVDFEISERSRIAGRYFEMLKDIGEIKLPVTEKKASPIWYVFSIQAKNRDGLKEYMNEKGIGTSLYYPLPMHLQECFAGLGYKKGDFPVSEKLCETSVALPVFSGMTDDMIEYICDVIKEFYKK
jgi:UDP-2-acetamido-2-deoxy-ribo-hexuluronate aminotransferase